MNDGNEKMERAVVHAICMNHPENSLLLVLVYDKNTDGYVWGLPGDEVKPRESLKEALRRILCTEMKGAIFALEGEFLKETFYGETPFLHGPTKAHLCEVSCMGGQNMTTAREIPAFYWIYHWQAEEILKEKIFDDEQGYRYPVSPVTRDILAFLLSKGSKSAFIL